MGKRVHVYGLARSTEVKHKRNGGDVFGAEVVVLSEPEGETIGILGFINTVSPQELAALVGSEVHVIADVEANSGSSGGAFLNLTLIQIERWKRPTATELLAPAFEQVSGAATAPVASLAPAEADAA